MTHSTYSVADRVYFRLASKLDEPDGGFTVSPQRGDVSVGPREGFAVAEHPDRNRQYAGFVDSHHIRSYVLENDELLREPGKYLGGWRDPETMIAHLDVVSVYNDQADAERVARDNGELAIWDFAARQSIRV